MTDFYNIGPFRLDLSIGVLSLEGQPLPLGPRRSRGAVGPRRTCRAAVTKERILEAAWFGVVVGEANLTVQVAAIRKTLARIGGAEHWIETLPRRGYRFSGQVST